MNQEQIMQMQMIEQEANQLNEQLRLIDQNMEEMQEIDLSLEEIGKSENNNNILANIGKKIYLPVEIKEKPENLRLIVEVGKGHLVKKSISETKEIIQEQMVKLVKAKGEINEKIEQLQFNLQNMFDNIRKEQAEEKKKNDKIEDIVEDKPKK